MLNFLYFVVINFSTKMPHHGAVIEIAFYETVYETVE